ncbi:hypothetical protein [Budvicia aquatica]|uniref:hypothetical protein n=1 Tax=Budvicia aquatica TaxID=82979 RepID=UPI00208D1FED|nr:hypothetical protein [Budvicia aquatica]GKX52225.1 hypothetical protein SOASR029_25340 [Budvicia aquatica]
MTEVQFDCDKALKTMSYREAEELSPVLASLYRSPSMYDPTRCVFYLSSLDENVDVSDPEHFYDLLTRVKDAYKRACCDAKYVNHSKAFSAREDFIVLCGLMMQHSEEPEKYSDPDELLFEAIRQ